MKSAVSNHSVLVADMDIYRLLVLQLLTDLSAVFVADYWVIVVAMVKGLCLPILFSRPTAAKLVIRLEPP